MAFLLLISVDIFSHWLQMYSSLVAGDLSHKVNPRPCTLCSPQWMCFRWQGHRASRHTLIPWLRHYLDALSSLMNKICQVGRMQCTCFSQTGQGPKFSVQETHNQNWLIQQYYGHRLFMGFCCVSCEVLYLAVYIADWQTRAASPLQPGQSSMLMSSQPRAASFIGINVHLIAGKC